jgi:peptidoglycan/xylan/chitin deacetylase (PgdA/CDA1 family)
MKPSILIRKSLARPLYALSRTGAIFGGRTCGDFVILMFHRIVRKQPSEPWIQEGMYVDPETFDRQVRFLKERFHVASLAGVPRLMSLHPGRNTNRPHCMLTFDDGWKDFHEFAFPILKSHGVEATVFLPTDFIGTAKRFWTDRLAVLLTGIESRRNDRGIAAGRPDPLIDGIEGLKGPAEARMEKAIELLKPLPSEEIDHVLEALAEKWGIDSEGTGGSFLSWEEIREMRRSGIVSFGSHTRSHRILTTVSEDVAREELIRSRERLLAEGAVSPSFIPFAYPNGNHDDRIADLVAEAGYDLAVTTESGWNDFGNPARERFKLKRIGIHQDMASTDSMLACRIYGIY